MSFAKAVFTPVQSKRTFEQVSSQIRTLILKRVLKPGDRLPSEKKLAEQFNVGRQTIREALRILELSGFITVQKGFGGGPIIKNTILVKTTNLLLDVLQMEKISVEEFTAARLVIEKAILNDVFDHANEQDISNLKENIAKAKDLVAKKEMATDVNFEFHSLLARASRNKVFVILEKAINTIHHNLRKRAPANFKITKTGVQEHEKILDAIIKKERNRAINLLEKDILLVQKSIESK